MPTIHQKCSKVETSSGSDLNYYLYTEFCVRKKLFVCSINSVIRISYGINPSVEMHYIDCCMHLLRFENATSGSKNFLFEC